MDYSSIIEICEAQLRSGQIQKVLAEVQKLDIPRVPAQFKAQLAAIARRAGEPSIGLHLLSAEIKEDFSNIEASLEYCTCLKDIGAIYEAKAILNQLETEDYPAAHICEINLAFSQSEYGHVIAAADSYLDRFDAKSYQAGVVSINRLAAKIALGHIDQELEDEFHRIFLWFKSEKWMRLVANCHELHAQIMLWRKDYAKATEEIQKALDVGVSEGIKDHVFIKRWQAVIEARQNCDIGPLLEVKKVANSHYETLRAIDSEILRVKFDHERFHFLFFGTPFPAYRASLEKEFGQAPNTYFLHPEAPTELSLQTGELSGASCLALGGRTHLLFGALMSDFYRPIRIGTLFHEIFPDEVFDIENSKNRIHQIIFRARGWIDENELPLKIIESNQVYQLLVPPEIKLVLPKQVATSRTELMLNTLGASFQKRQFSTADVQKTLDVGATTALRVLSLGLNQNRLKRSGLGRKTSYLFTRE